MPRMAKWKDVENLGAWQHCWVSQSTNSKSYPSTGLPILWEMIHILMSQPIWVRFLLLVAENLLDQNGYCDLDWKVSWIRFPVLEKWDTKREATSWLWDTELKEYLKTYENWDLYESLLKKKKADRGRQEREEVDIHMKKPLERM